MHADLITIPFFILLLTPLLVMVPAFFSFVKGSLQDRDWAFASVGVAIFPIFFGLIIVMCLFIRKQWKESNSSSDHSVGEVIYADTTLLKDERDFSCSLKNGKYYDNSFRE